MLVRITGNTDDGADFDIGHDVTPVSMLTAAALLQQQAIERILAYTAHRSQTDEPHDS